MQMFILIVSSYAGCALFGRVEPRAGPQMREKAESRIQEFSRVPRKQGSGSLTSLRVLTQWMADDTRYACCNADARITILICVGQCSRIRSFAKQVGKNLLMVIPAKISKNAQNYLLSFLGSGQVFLPAGADFLFHIAIGQENAIRAFQAPRGCACRAQCLSSAFVPKSLDYWLVAPLVDNLCGHAKNSRVRISPSYVA